MKPHHQCPYCNNTYKLINLHIPSCERIQELTPTLLNEYKSGISTKALAQKYNISFNLVADVFKRVGIYRSKGDALKLSCVITPRVLSTETKKKISLARTKYLQNNPDKVPYLLNHSRLESYPEKRCRLLLTEIGLVGWIQKYQHSIYEYDFAFPELKIDLEIDGGTHQTEAVQLIDVRRDRFSIDHGWTVIRFTASEFKTNANDCINKLIHLIYTIDPTYPLYDIDRWTQLKPKLLSSIKVSYCTCGRKMDRLSTQCRICYNATRTEISIKNDNKVYCKCGNEKAKHSEKCKECDAKIRHISASIDRPSYQQLKYDLSNMSYVAVGRKYGVSDNAIRKWIRYYETHKT